MGSAIVLLLLGGTIDAEFAALEIASRELMIGQRDCHILRISVARMQCLVRLAELRQCLSRILWNL